MNDKVDLIIKEVESIIAEYEDYENQSDSDVYYLTLGWRECAYCLLDYIHNLDKKLNTEEVSNE